MKKKRNGLRQDARVHLERVLKTLDGPEVGRDVSTAEWREILEEVATAVANRLSCLDDESAQSESR